jgi:hypothetical protein
LPDRGYDRAEKNKPIGNASKRSEQFQNFLKKRAAEWGGRLEMHHSPWLEAPFLMGLRGLRGNKKSPIFKVQSFKNGA